MAYPTIEVQFIRSYQRMYFAVSILRAGGHRAAVIRHEYHGGVSLGKNETDAQLFVRCTEEMAKVVKRHLNLDPLRADEQETLPGF